MRTTLTLQESATLIAKGISADKASEIKEYDDEVSQWTHRGAPIFTLADICGLLPKHISFANAEWYLNIQWDILWGKWYVQYLDFDHDDKVVKEEEATELIDALYLLTLAVINHVKLD